MDSNKSLMKVRLQTVRSHVQASWKAPTRDRFGTLYKNCITKIRECAEDLWDPRIPTMVQAYFEDMDVITPRPSKKGILQCQSLAGRLDVRLCKR